MIYSHSTLEALAECQAQGVLSMGDRVMKAGPARQGNWAHGIAEQYINHLITTGLESDIEHGKELAKNNSALITPSESADILDVVFRWIERFDASSLLAADEVASEKRRWLNLDGEWVANPWNVSDPVYGFTCDLSWKKDGHIHILDFKSGRLATSLKNPETKRQLQRYAGALGRGMNDVTVHVDNMRFGRPDSVEFSADETWDFWSELIVSAIKFWEARLRRKSDKWRSATTGPHCADCDFRWRCPVYDRYGSAFEKYSPEQLVGIVRALEDKLGSAKELLRKNLNEKPIEVDGFRAELAQVEKVSFDNLRLRDSMREFVSDDVIDSAFAATKTSVNKAMTKAKIKPKERKAYLEAFIAKAGDTSYTTRMSIKRVGEVEDEAGSGG